MLFGLQKSHTFFYGRFHKGSSILWIDWLLFGTSAILMRISRSRLASYASWKDGEEQIVSDRTGDASYYVLELQRYFVLDMYQEKLKTFSKMF